MGERVAEKRRSPRAAQNVTIQLVGMQPGQSSAVAQLAQTISVNEQGSLLECRSKFEVGAEVMIHNPVNLQNGLFRVVRAALAPAGAAWNIAVELQERNMTDFWGLR